MDGNRSIIGKNRNVEVKRMIWKRYCKNVIEWNSVIRTNSSRWRCRMDRLRSRMRRLRSRVSRLRSRMGRLMDRKGRLDS